MPILLMGELNIENEAVEAAAITDGEAPEETPEAAASTDALSGEQQTEEPAATEPSEEAPAGPAGEAPVKRKTLTEVVEENRRKAEEAASEEDKAPAESGAESEASGEKKPEEKPEAKDDLKVDEIDKVHANDSVSARDRIKQLATLRDELKSELDPLKDTFELLGGQEGVDQLLSKIEVLEDPTKADDFVALVEAAPNFEEFKQKHFWKELDNPANQQMIVEDKFGEGYTMERLARLVEAEKAGLIDLDDIASRSDEFRLSEEDLKRKREQKAEVEQLRKEIAELKKPSADAAKEQQRAEVAQRWNEFGESYDTELLPILDEFAIRPVETDPKEVVEAKLRHWDNIATATQAAFLKDPLFMEIGKMIEAGATDTITFKNKARRFKPVYLDITKKAIIKEMPFLHGTLDAVSKQLGKSKGANAPKANSKDQNPPKTQPENAPAVDASQKMQTEVSTERKGPDLRDEQERKTAFQRAVERSAAARR